MFEWFVGSLTGSRAPAPRGTAGKSAACCVAKPRNWSTVLRTNSADSATGIRRQSRQKFPDSRDSSPPSASVSRRLTLIPSECRCAIRFIEHRLGSLNVPWEGEPRIARDEIAKHVGRITLRPMLTTYVATGVWDWLGGLEPAAAMVVPGAGLVHSSPRTQFQIEVAA